MTPEEKVGEEEHLTATQKAIKQYPKPQSATMAGRVEGPTVRSVDGELKVKTTPNLAPSLSPKHRHNVHDAQPRKGRDSWFA